MSIFVGKPRALAMLALVLALVCTLGVTLTGCSSSDNSDTEKSKATTLVIKHELVAERALENSVKSIELSGFNAKGSRTFSPEVYGRVNVITKVVSVETTSIRLLYRDDNNEVVGVYAQAVHLVAGETCTIDNPAWQDVSSQTYITQLTISPEATIITVGDVVQFAVKAQVGVDGISFPQEITEDVAWKLGSSAAVIVDLGGGTFRGALPGVETVTASFGSVEDTAKVTVNTQQVDLSLSSLNLNSYDGAYIMPLSYDDQDNVLDAYNTGLNFACPIIFVDIENADDDPELLQHITVQLDNEDVATSEISVVYDNPQAKEGSRPVIKLHPKKVGTSTVTVFYAEPTSEGTPIYHSGSVNIKVVDVPFLGFAWNDTVITGISENIAALPLGTGFPIKISAVFCANLEVPEAEYYEVRDVNAIEHKFEGKYLSGIKWLGSQGYALKDGTTYVYTSIAAQSQPDSMYLNEWFLLTAITPKSSEFILEKEFIGHHIKLSLNIVNPIPVRMMLDGFDEVIEGYDAHAMTVGDTMSIKAKLLYSDNTIKDITENCLIDHTENGAVEFTSPTNFTAVQDGREFIYVTDYASSFKGVFLVDVTY